MDLGVVVLIIVAAWLGVFVVVLAICKVASEADDRELGVRKHVRAAPQLHRVYLHRG